jgi:hypothetical protein
MRAILAWTFIVLGGLPAVGMLLTALNHLAAYSNRPSTPASVAGDVEQFIAGQGAVGSLVLFAVFMLPVIAGAWLLRNERRDRAKE